MTRSTSARSAAPAIFGFSAGIADGWTTHRFQARREAGDLRRPVGEQRGRRHQQRRLAFAGALLFQHQQQRQHLDGLAEAHVVGEARAESEPGEQMQPLHAGLLIGPQRAVERSPGIDARETVGPAQLGQRLREPRPGDGLAPVGVALDGARVPGNSGARQQAHRLAERQALGGGPPLDRLELIERPAQSFMIDFDPLAADEGEPVGLREQALDLGRRQRLAVERHLHAEVEQRVQPELRRRLAADRRLHLRTRRPVHAPARRHAHDDAGAFQRRNVLQELQRLLRAPAQRMKDLAGVDHRLQPGALLGGALHRHQQRQQALAVFRAGIFLQGLAERQMLRLGLRRQPRRVGGQEGERGLFVLAVLGEIEMHAPDQIPGGMTGFEEVLNSNAGFGQFNIEGRIHASPEIGEDRSRQVLRTGHGRNRGGQFVQFVFGGNRDGRLGPPLADTGKSAQRGHVARPKLAPIRQRPAAGSSRPRRRPGIESMTGAPDKRIPHLRTAHRIQGGRFLRRP